MATKAQSERIAKGLCPNCGKEAAPYYLCHDCRLLAKISRICRGFTRAGGFERVLIDGRVGWKYKNKDACQAYLARSRPDPKEGDKRLEPRLRGMRIDVESTIIEIIRYAGRPCTIEDITAAWGKLRAKRDAPLAADLSRIIVAEEKRKARNAKRLRIKHDQKEDASHV